ncbi:MAG: glutathione ABC transporter permease [Fimbriimonadales bacterium]
MKSEWRFVGKRLLMAIPTLLFVSALTFVAAELAPSDPIQVMAGEHATPEAVTRLRHEYGLDRPAYVRFASFVWGAVTLDFGRSFFDPRPVRDIIVQTYGPTALLACLAMCLAATTGIALGIIAAVNAGRRLDRLVVTFGVAGLGVPNFVLAPLLVLVFALHLEWAEVAGWGDSSRGLLPYLVLPVIVLAVRPMAAVMRLTRTAMIDALSGDFIRTARAKGVSRWGVIFRHALPNALTPTLIVIGTSFGYLLTGSFIVETAFAIPGLGYRAIQAIQQRDYPMIQATTVLFAAAFVIVNLLVDIVQARVDPRVRADLRRRSV